MATGVAPAGAGSAPFEELWEHEGRLVDGRRKIALGVHVGAGTAATPPRVGIALSGGGIRSATFCLGLLRGLAQNGHLKRLDYLSTVSGGGFAGAMLGRLIASLGIHQAQEVLARGDSLLLWWLRSNGRYLTPSGSRDMGMALVTYFRAWFAVQLEMAIMCLLVVLVIVAPHLLQDATHLLSLQDWPAARTPWWPLAGLWLAFTAPAVMAAYWIVRDPPMQARPGGPSAAPAAPGVDAGPVRSRPRILAAVLAAEVATALAWWAVQHQAIFSLPSARALLEMTAASMAIAIAATWLRLPPKRAPARALAGAEVRNELTRALRLSAAGAAMLAGLGALDWSSWEVLHWLLSEGAEHWWLSSTGLGIGGLALVLLRTFAEPLQKMAASVDGDASGDLLPRLLNLAGMLGAALLFFTWLVTLQWAVFVAPWPFWPEATAAMKAGSLLLVALARLLGTSWMDDMANATSLHSFYRARLTRAYLSVGNPRRFGDVAAAAGPDAVSRASPVTEVVPGDDTSLASYQPETSGGPIHLVNACLNQSRDDRSGLYNADRKGMLLTASARGFELGRDRYLPADASYDPGTLGRWVAISGAAASPGAGSYTSRGWALLLFLLGVRLGYWVKAPQAQLPSAGGTHPAWRYLVKHAMLRAEATATFFGLARPWWYLSDGGHFENTGVYPLLRRELDFILVADCGADPKFEFNDLENLVRKARTDFDADIEFYTQDEAGKLFQGHPGQLSVLSPETLADNRAARGVLMARITYRRSDPLYRRAGTLLVVKPNLHPALDIDVLSYARRNKDFPQQSTGNQFFDEAQWESYHRLGEDFGRAMTPPWLNQVPGWSVPVERAPGTVAPLRKAQAPRMPDTESAAWRKTAQAAAVGTTIGVGALVSLMAAGWQVIDQARKTETDRLAQIRLDYDNLEKGLAEVTAGADKIAAQAITHAQDLLRMQRQKVLAADLQERGNNLVREISERCSKAATGSAANFCEKWQGLQTAGASSQAGKAANLEYWRLAPAHVEPLPPVPIKPAPRPFAAGAAPTPKPPAPACMGQRLYTQIYDESMRAKAMALNETFDAQPPTAGLRTLGIENVTRTAQLENTRRPVPWPAPTLIVHTAAGNACAEAIKSLIGPEAGEPAQIKPLPAQLKPQPGGVIELWLPTIQR